MTDKICKTCGGTFSLDSFTKVKQNSDGHSGSCKSCDNKKKVATPEQARARYLRWKEKHPEKAGEYYAKIKDDPEYKQKRAERVKEYRQANPGWMSAHCANRRALRLQATAEWDQELTEFVNDEAHHLRGLRDAVTGIEWHVDHVVPLQGKHVCGLHVWNNFQVIPKKLNLQKLNRNCDEFTWSRYF